jgi:hypothetical protein
MDSTVNREPYDFSNDYKILPAKKRVTLIKIARNLLKQQKEDSILLADIPLPIREERQELV